MVADRGKRVKETGFGGTGLGIRDSELVGEDRKTLFYWVTEEIGLVWQRTKTNHDE